MERIEITRAEFEERFGIKPDASIIGFCFVAEDRKTILEEFVFTDEAASVADDPEVAELERLYKL